MSQKNYILQITAFAAIIVLDARRTESGRMDCCPCITLDESHCDQDNYSDRLIKSPQGREEFEYGGEDYRSMHAHAPPPSAPSLSGPPRIPDSSTPSGSISSSRNAAAAADPFMSGGEGASPDDEPSQIHHASTRNEGCLQRFMRQHYVPFLLHRFTKMVVLVVFVLTFIFMVGYGIHNLELGLDHKYVVPKDSYLQNYFDDLKNVFAVGPPVYFVIQPSNLTDFQFPINQNRICSQSGCSQTSVQALIFNQVCDPAAYIAQGPSSWIDDYITWLKIRAPCCRTFKVRYGHEYAKGDWCPVTFSDSLCEMCLQPEDFITYNNVTRPPPVAFTKYLEMYLDKSKCSTACGSCGWGHNADVIWDSSVNKTGATRYMAYHSPLRSEEDFINALKSGRRINQEIIDSQGLNAYVYSVVYPYFEQYLYIVDTCILNTGLGMVGIFVLSMALIRNLWASLQIVIAIIMILGDLLGVMALWGVTLNALSVLNYVMAIGISVEFCIHLTVAFMHTAGPRDFRVGSSLVTVGSSIISGITLTKFSGVIVLAAATSEVFEIYYFRMYLAIVVLGK